MNTGNSDGNVVEVRAESGEPPSWLSALTTYIHHVLRHIAVSRWEVSVLLCDESFIQQLNRQYRGIDAPTDVLSFSAGDENEDGTTHAGDIVVSLPVVKRQAEELGVEYEEEIRRVVVHGLLHLHGYEHRTNDFSREPMLTLQENIVQELKEKLF